MGASGCWAACRKRLVAVLRVPARQVPDFTKLCRVARRQRPGLDAVWLGKIVLLHLYYSYLPRIPRANTNRWVRSKSRSRGKSTTPTVQEISADAALSPRGCSTLVRLIFPPIWHGSLHDLCTCAAQIASIYWSGTTHITRER